MDLTDKNLSPKKLPDRRKRLAKGCTTLMYSCQQGKSDDIVTELRIKPKSLYHRDKSNKSALHYCCGQLDLVAAASITAAAPDLLESADEDGLTPLHLAVIQGNAALVNLLIANKANVNAIDNEGHSVVHWAAVCGEVEALRALLAAGADITITDLNGGSPLHYAAQMSNGQQQHSANLALEILEIFLQQPNVQVDVCDKDGRQPLLWAASAGAVKAVLMLVKAGARIESADKDGLTALHCAASRGHTECINVLINLCGAPIDLIDENGCTALHYAVTLGHADATYLLLELGADPNRQDRKGRTPAHCGCARGKFETVKMLRDRKANMWLRNAKGDLPLHEAASSGRRELVLWLLDQRPKHVNTTSNDGRTILHIAASNDYTDMCKMLIDFGADINCIYRLPGNVVQTPLDCALNNGHRSTAKFLQLHGGLPANKLRLSGRNPNALNDQELVKPLPLTFGVGGNSGTDKKPQRSNANVASAEQPKKTRSVWLYLDQSDSDAEMKPQANYIADHQKSPAEKTQLRKSCGCHYHYHHHYRHRCRFRSNSCERIEILQRDSGPDSSICRSKSNVEICLYHKKKPSKSRRDATSSEEQHSTSEEESASSEYCHRNYHRRKRDSQRTKDKTKTVSSGKETMDREKSGAEVKVVGGAAATAAAAAVKRAEKDGSSNEQTQEKKEIAKKDRSGKEKKESEIRVEKEAKSVAQKSESERQMADGGKSKETKTETVDSQKTLTTDNKTIDETTKTAITTKSIVIKADVHSGSIAQEESVTTVPVENANTIAASAGADTGMKSDSTEIKVTNETKEIQSSTQLQSKADQATATGEKTGASAADEKVSTETVTVQEQSASSVQAATAPPPPSSPQPAPTASTSPVKNDTSQEKNDDTKEADNVENVQGSNDANTKKVKIDTNTATESANAAAASNPTQDIAGSLEANRANQSEMATKSEADKKAEDTTASKDQAENQNEAANMKAGGAAVVEEGGAPNDAKTDAKKANADASESFQVLPKDKQPQQQQQQTSDNLNQEKDDTGNLGPPNPPTGEPIRKTSFTVLKSDESVDDLLAGMNENDDADIQDDGNNKIATASGHSKSFKVLKAHGASGEDIILQQSSDQETGGNENYEDYMTRNLATYSGKYSDSELISGQLNGRRKKYKKRAKSVKQLTIVDGLSKDQDSGFEPSPRTVRSSTTQRAATTRAIYTANLPERPRVGDIIDCRSASSRFESLRKPGDKNAVNMSTVQQTLQRNIRRYYMEHKIFQHLLELKSLQIRSSKVNESLLVKRAVDDYHKSTVELGGETGSTLRRYPYKEYTFKNFEIFLYEVLKSLQKSGSNNFQNLSDVYLEAERRLSPDYARCKKALYCTSKTHRCLHAAHAYTGIPCAAYIPMMNHHTMPKYGFGKTSMGSFYLPKICTKGGGIGGTSKCGSGNSTHNTVSLELSHGNNKQLITLPAEKLDNNKRYYVTFTLKENGSGVGGGAANAQPPAILDDTKK